VTTTAYDGFMALDVAMSFQPQIIVLDLSMPRFSGDEVAPMLRQINQFKDVYIIALTSYDCSEARALTSRTGFDLHLTKPVNMTEMYAALERGAAALPCRVAETVDS
jgi:CheY-like chemotaxis protein